ncbi:hypothetical protein Nepgr_023098 [Nepenthes gracilis]|uniref:Uncharacterized protein n=1 Tax=Nepenthes gracilis TaxID=150966 RepID=A0AAD3XZ19_NEPGR|nr:hypothetical protein Nepgr_023098 [Nepenthes gracilis]
MSVVFSKAMNLISQICAKAARTPRGLRCYCVGPHRWPSLLMAGIIGPLSRASQLGGDSAAAAVWLVDFFCSADAPIEWIWCGRVLAWSDSGMFGVRDSLLALELDAAAFCVSADSAGLVCGLFDDLRVGMCVLRFRFRMDRSSFSFTRGFVIADLELLPVWFVTWPALVPISPRRSVISWIGVIR